MLGPQLSLVVLNAVWLTLLICPLLLWRYRRAVLAGYDWGGRGACVVAALWPERCSGLLSFNSYNIQNIAKAMVPDTPENERSLWYQYYFHSERGRAGLVQDRRGVCRLLWRTWSPTWAFDDATFDRSAAAFDNPDFVDVVIQSYRHRFGLVPGDPALAGIEARLAEQPAITVPTLTFDGADDGVRPRWPRSASSSACAPLHRPAGACGGAGRGPQHAAGGAGGVCRRRAAAGARPGALTGPGTGRRRDGGRQARRPMLGD